MIENPRTGDHQPRDETDHKEDHHRLEWSGVDQGRSLFRGLGNRLDHIRFSLTNRQGNLFTLKRCRVGQLHIRSDGHQLTDELVGWKNVGRWSRVAFLLSCCISTKARLLGVKLIQGQLRWFRKLLEDISPKIDRRNEGDHQPHCKPHQGKNQSDTKFFEVVAK